jgi:signal transduction histidine kinase
MNFKSIRWRLPLSYAAIALLAALSLGSVMLLVLNGYYARQERDYLLGNAQALQPMVENALQTDQPDYLQETVRGLAFISQTRIRVLDEHGNVAVDSGIPNTDQLISVSGGVSSNVVIFSIPARTPNESGANLVTTVPLNEEPSVFVSGGTFPAETDTAILTVGASPYGYAFVAPQQATNAITSDIRRSSQKISLTLTNSLGVLEISDGPAYGRDIIRSVSLAWAVAGVVAILLAALAGWVASRQVIHPVLALTNVTQRMEGGDLSVRVNLPEKKPAAEFQALAHSFNGMAQRVEDTVSTLRTFVADAAHELHTPLTALHTNLELAADETDATRRSLFLQSAQEQSHRLETLVSGLLDLSRIEAAGNSSDLVLMELNPLVQELGEQFATRSEQSGRFFTLELPAETIQVRANDLQLNRSLTNLLENALKFTPPGGTITLRLVAQDNEAIISVLDTGIGIPPEDLPHLFERFHRGRNASRYPGSGLGLAITRALVNAHRGAISADSKTGEGTTITIKLPVSQG